MKKAENVKMKASDLFAASDKTMEYLGNDKEKVQQQSVRGLQSALSDNPTPLNCRRCGDRFKPEPHQWIFYELCDTCFAKFVCFADYYGKIPRIMLHKRIGTVWFTDHV